jgi:tetratricopeptide (TPR) repeat protein
MTGTQNRSNPNQDPDHDRDRSSDRREDRRGQSVQTPSLTRMVLLLGFVALVCGVVGAWGYSHFVGSAKSGDQNSSGKNSQATESSDSSNEDSGNGKLHVAEAAWKAAIKELHQAQAAEKAAQRSEEETKAILDFFKKNLFSAGRPGDGSLAEAFWAGGQGKDVTLRKAVDLTESRVAEAFADRPLGEASAREILGLAYWGLGDAAQAVKQYERALALRESLQGFDHSDTADCRNQLAVTYRLAGRTDDASRLFDRNPYSPAHASALAVRGSALLFQKKPAEAELQLRECLTIRQKIQPDDWTTFDTKSMLGEALLDQKKFVEAEPMLLSGYEGMKQREDTIPSRDKPRLNKALERLVTLYEAWGKNDQAMRWRKELETAGATKKS